MLSSGTLCELRITILLHIRHFNQIVRRSLVGICAKFQGHNSKEKEAVAVSLLQRPLGSDTSVTELTAAPWRAQRSARLLISV